MDRRPARRAAILFSPVAGGNRDQNHTRRERGSPALRRLHAAGTAGRSVGAGTAAVAAPAPAPSPTPEPLSPPPAGTREAEPLIARPNDSTRVADSAKVARRSADLFGDSAATVAPAGAAAPSWDIDVHSYESTARVEHYVQYFSGPAKERIQARLERGTRYEPMIRAQMRAGGLPEDMYYLALVESGFDPNAYSRAAAVGMWQFMTSTARDMGLRVDWWVDERRDPVKSTAAAVRFIKGLREQFGSLYLAAAAYNGGPGRVTRGLTRYADDLEGTSGDDLFFALAEKDYLRNETREYVPQLIAAALIAKEPERYGMKLEPQPPLVYDSVVVGPATPLSAIAHAAAEHGAGAARAQSAAAARHHAAEGLVHRATAGKRGRQLRRGVRAAAEERATRHPHGDVQEGRKHPIDRHERGHQHASAVALQSQGQATEEREPGARPVAARADGGRGDGVGGRCRIRRSSATDRRRAAGRPTS